MPSGLNQILPRMRVTSDALRISALVVAGVTTGYFWRAAFEGSPSTHPVSAPVNIVEPTPKPPVLSTVKPKPVVPTPHIAPSAAVLISSPVTAFRRRDAVAERPADFSATSRPRGRRCRPRRRPLRRLSRARRRRPSRLRLRPRRPRRRRPHLRRGLSRPRPHRRRSSRSRPLSRLLPPRATTMTTTTPRRRTPRQRRQRRQRRPEQARVGPWGREP